MGVDNCQFVEHTGKELSQSLWRKVMLELLSNYNAQDIKVTTAWYRLHEAKEEPTPEEVEQSLQHEALVDAYCEFGEDDETLEEFDGRYIQDDEGWGMVDDSEQEETPHSLL